MHRADRPLGRQRSRRSVPGLRPALDAAQLDVGTEAVHPTGMASSLPSSVLRNISLCVLVAYFLLHFLLFVR